MDGCPDQIPAKKAELLSQEPFRAAAARRIPAQFVMCTLRIHQQDPTIEGWVAISMVSVFLGLNTGGSHSVRSPQQFA